MSTIQSRLESWLEARGQSYSPEAVNAAVAKAEEECYTCAKAPELKRVVLTAAIMHLKRRQEREGIMGKIVLVTSDNCPPCGEVVEVLKPLIDDGDIEVIDYSTCEDCDKEAITKAGISTFPSLAIRSTEGLMVSPLSLAPKAEEVGVKERTEEPEERRVQPRVRVEESEEVGEEEG